MVAARGGAGTLAELAAFGLPSVIVPFPLAFANHQWHNAQEFVQMGAAQVVGQEVLNGDTLRSALAAWLDDPGRREAAQSALKEWDVPDAPQRILVLLDEAARGGPKR